MFKRLQGTELVRARSCDGVNLYRLDAPHLNNSYYIVSSEKTRRLQNSPEVVGFAAYDAMLAPTQMALNLFKEQGIISDANILTILRGGLNYPLEESCYRADITVNDMSFLSCERVFENEIIAGLDLKYKKLNIVPGSTVLMGDILATGDTLVTCFKYVMQQYRGRHAALRNIIFFTIGSNTGINVLENLTEELREYWPDFEGITCVYYEGIYSFYHDKGVTGANRPYVDFYWKDSVLAPEYREQTLSNPNALFEKCTIYDGGARRYQIPEHYEEVMDYWEHIAVAADTTLMADFLAEKLGHPLDIGYPEWVTLNHYNRFEEPLLQRLYLQERAFIDSTLSRSLKSIAQMRMAEIRSSLGNFAG